MKAASFEFVRPASIAEATSILASESGAARPVAGCQSLGPMLNLRLAQPRILVDITGIPELTQIESEGDTLTLGACVSTATIEDGRPPLDGLEMMGFVAAGIAYRAVRNRGTIGGSICHADPASDWVSSLMVLGAECVIEGPDGTHSLPIEQFITGAFEVALNPGELLRSVRIHRVSKNAGWKYQKICRKPGEFAMAIGTVLNDPERRICRAVIGATDSRPHLIENARGLLNSAHSDRAVFTNDPTVKELLQPHNLLSRSDRRFHVEALRRAIAGCATC